MKPGRNAPCSCGSGKKYKNCCLGKSEPSQNSLAPSPIGISHLEALFSSGRHAELESCARALLEKNPNDGVVWKLLGLSLQMQGKKALSALQKAAQLLPDDAEAHANLAGVLRALGRLDEAVASGRRAVQIKPDFTEAHNNLGVALQDLSQLGDAVESYRNAIKFKPDFAEAHFNLGRALKDLGQLDEAAASCRSAIRINPDFAAAHSTLGILLHDLGLFSDAVASYCCALKIKPGFAQDHYNLGIALGRLDQFDRAAASYRRALEIKPDYAEAHFNLGSALQKLNQPDEATASYRRALRVNPDFIVAHSNLLFSSNFSANLTPKNYLADARQFGRMIARKVESRFSAWHCAADPKRLRIGMVSGDFRNHPVSYFLESFLAHIDPARIELIAYSTNLFEDGLTERIKPHFAAWKSLAELSDEAAACLIHADGVHILLDLSGHTALNRLPLFACKPAPIQASWLGYFASTGVSEMDYLIADRVGVPDANRAQFTETVWYLPDTRLCFSPPKSDQPVAPLPAQNNGHITFGCFQRLNKVGNEVLAAWESIFIALPSSRMSWQCEQLQNPAAVQQLMQRLQLHGIDPARVTLHGGVSREEYLAAHAEVDFILDTFPYPGGTTTCEALWMGVPTLTLAGETLLARQGASLLTAAGLEDWVATSVADYINKAITLSSDLSKLAALRANLREQVRTSPLFDAPRFVRNLEDALWGMWRKQPPL